jgi:hypothetical protein
MHRSPSRSCSRRRPTRRSRRTRATTWRRSPSSPREKEPKLPTPQIDPQRVADAILHAAEHHQRSVKVGGTAVANTLVSKIAPSLGDKLAAKQADRQQYDEPPRNPQGTLNQPGESGRVKGTGGVKEKGKGNGGKGGRESRP